MRKLRRDPVPTQGNDPAVHAIADIPKVRACLCCGVDFESSGFGERVCRRCKSSSTWRDGSLGGSSRK